MCIPFERRRWHAEHVKTAAVPWQRVLAALAAVAVTLTGVIVAFRADGFQALDATVPRATRWFVDQASGRVVLADGFSGRALARLDTSDDGQVLEVAQSASGVVVVDRSAAVRTRTTFRKSFEKEKGGIREEVDAAV